MRADHAYFVMADFAKCLSGLVLDNQKFSVCVVAAAKARKNSVGN